MILTKLKTSNGRRRESWPLHSAARSFYASWRTLGVAILLVLAATTIMLVHFYDVNLHRDHLFQRLPHGAIPRRLVKDLASTVVRENLGGLLSVRDIVAFPDELMLMIAALDGTQLPSKHELHCLFEQKHKTAVSTSDWKDDYRSILAVRCKYPPEPRLESQQVTVILKNSTAIVPSGAQVMVNNSSWKPLVYETVTLTDSVLLFVKGLQDSRGKPHNYSQSLHKLSCCFGSSTTTRVIGVAQEVVRCELPSRHQIEDLRGAPISLAVPNMGVLQSVAYFDFPIQKRVTGPTTKRFHVCSCTMLWNEARFLREWVTYHGYLGIERWFLYDNNSEDDVGEILRGLQASDHNVTRHAWPWIKTQEAAFSHCALRARADCEWVLFTDVDEFLYSRELDAQSSTFIQREPNDSSKSDVVNSGHLPEGSSRQSNQLSLVRRLIEETVKKGAELGKKVGEVRLLCHNFGPSGLLHTPEEGVMVGYTCRMKYPQRHKSFILLEAMSESLQNVVHHFTLRDGYEQMAVPIRMAVINHYKYQVWEVFKAKFVRRAATYVVDWQDQTAQSNDRAPGLGLEAVEPPDWPARYCEEEDGGLRNFTWRVFRHPQTQRLPWQAPW